MAPAADPAWSTAPRSTRSRSSPDTATGCRSTTRARRRGVRLGTRATTCGGTAVTASTRLRRGDRHDPVQPDVDAGFCGDAFVGLSRTGSADGAELMLDDLLVEDLGASSAVPACAQLTAGLTPDVIEQGVLQEFVRRSPPTRQPTSPTSRSPSRCPRAGRQRRRMPLSRHPRIGRLARHPLERRRPGECRRQLHVHRERLYSTTVEPIGERSISAETAVRTLPGPPQADVSRATTPG